MQLYGQSRRRAGADSDVVLSLLGSNIPAKPSQARSGPGTRQASALILWLNSELYGCNPSSVSVLIFILRCFQMVSWPNFKKLARINLSISRPSHLSQWWLRPGCSLRVTTRGTSWPGPSWRRRYCWPYCPWRPPGSCPWTPQCWGWGRRQCHTGSPVTRLPSPGSHSVLYCDDHILFAFVEGKVSMSVLPISAKQTLVVDQRLEHFSWQLTIFVFYLRKGGIQEQSHYCSSVSVWTGLWKEIAKKRS